MGFYAPGPYESFRFGDVLKDFLTVSLVINNPSSSLPELNYQLNISSDYYVLLSPCCSIKDKVILLCPLKKMKPQFLRNSHFVEDLTRINRLVSQDKRVPDDEWQKFDETQKTERLARPDEYTNLETFVYQYTDLLPCYKLNYKDTLIERPPYVIDFRRIFSVICDKIDRKQSDVPLGAKLLELSPKTRRDLRDKMGFFFQRPADEDLQYLE